MIGTTRGARHPLVVAGLFAWVVALYAISLGNDFVYDDYGLIVRRPAPASVAEVAAIFTRPHHAHRHPYYRPLAALTMGLQKSLHGDWAAPFHLMNALVAGAVALLAYALLRRPAFGVPPGLALLGAGLFAVHPVASSCVYPISGREALLCAGFVIAASWAFLRGGARWRMAALAAFGAALLCREQAVVVPFLLVLADALGLPPDAPGRRPRRWLVRHLPFAAVLLLYLAVRSAVLASADVHRMVLLDEPTRPLLSFAYFLQTALAPFVELVYEPRPEVWAHTWRSWVWPLAVGVLAVLAVCGRAGLGRGALFWVGWVVLGLLPTANLLRQEAPFAERHVLMSLFGVVGLVCMLCATVWPRAGPRRAVIAAGVVLLVGCSAVSFHRSRYFHDNLAFFEQWVRTDAGAPQAHLSLGDWYDHAGRLDDAIAEYRTVLATHPRHVPTHYSLGEALLKRGEAAEAATHFEFVVRYQPNAAWPHYKLGLAFLLQDRLSEAAAQFQETIRIDPRHAQAHSKLGVTCARDGRHAEAVVHYRRALTLDPELAEARHNLPVSLEKLRRRGAAEAERPSSP